MEDDHSLLSDKPTRSRLSFGGNKNVPSARSYQIRIFVLTYLTYAILHFNRESWSILKLKIQDRDGVTSTSLGALDTSFLAFYSIGLFVSGSLGDHFNPKWLLVGSFILVTVLTTTISIFGMYNWMNIVFFSFLFAVNGTVQSVGWPCVNSVFANWFGKKGRGTLIGVWQSCSNAGNVLGAMITSFLTSTAGFSWEVTYMVVGFFCLAIALVNMGLLVVHPEEKGIVIEEIDRRMSIAEDQLRRESLKKAGGA